MKVCMSFCTKSTFAFSLSKATNTGPRRPLRPPPAAARRGSAICGRVIPKRSAREETGSIPRATMAIARSLTHGNSLVR